VPGTERLLVAFGVEGIAMSCVDQAAAASKAAPNGQDRAGKQDRAERFTPLLTREAYTFSRMRIDRGGPRVNSAIRLPGWKSG
jgi:hypothetical protein